MEKKKSIFLVILLCILVVVAAGGSSYLVLADAHNQETQALNDQIDKLESDFTKLRSEAKTAVTTTATTTPDPTKDWKSFENTDLKISFKYPTNWGIATYSTYTDGQTANSHGFKIIFSSSDVVAGGVNKRFNVNYGPGISQNYILPTYTNGKCTFNSDKKDAKPYEWDCQKILNNDKLPVYYAEQNIGDMFGKYIVGYIPLNNTTFPLLTIVNSGTHNNITDEAIAPTDSEKTILKQLLSTSKYTK